MSLLKEFQLLLLVIIARSIATILQPSVIRSPNSTDIPVELNQSGFASILVCAPRDANISYDAHYTLTIDGVLTDTRSSRIDYNLSLSHMNTEGNGYLITIYQDNLSLDIVMRVLNDGNLDYTTLKITVDIINKVTGDPIGSGESFTFSMVEDNSSTTNEGSVSNVDERLVHSTTNRTVDVDNTTNRTVDECQDSHYIWIGVGLGFGAVIFILFAAVVTLACCLHRTLLKLKKVEPKPQEAIPKEEAKTRTLATA